MKEKTTLETKIVSRTAKRPSKLVNGVLRIVARKILSSKLTIIPEFKKDFRKAKGPYILISNHASREDYLFNTAFLKERFNYVVGHNEFYRSHLSGTLNNLHAIPKKNFTPDFYAMREITRILKNGGCVSIYPEGMSSISGHGQPVAVGTGKFLKHFKVPVYFTKIKGGYLFEPKYNCEDRFGTIEVEFDQMFTIEELEKYSPEEIEDIVNEKLYQDDYKWNLEKGYTYQTNGKIADNLEDLLYICPKCGKQHRMKGHGNIIECLECGNGASIDDSYKMTPLNNDCVIPETQTAWFDWEREVIKKEIQNPDFELREKVKLGNLPKYKELKNKETSIIVGEGEIILNHNGLTYNGTRNGEKFSFHLGTNEVPTFGMCTDVTRFYTFYNGEFMEFYPENKTVEKWFMAAEELHRMHGGKWQDYKFRR